MNLANGCIAYDSEGVRRDFQVVPYHLTHLHDNPYRSLAGELCRSGGFAKNVTPFSEFLWADFFRNLNHTSLVKQDLNKALTQAKKLARTQEARYLPGWCGVSETA